MRGKLHKTQTGWIVTYITRKPHNNMLDIGELQLHPDDYDSVSGTYIDDDYITRYVHDGKNVEIRMHSVYEHGYCDEEPVRYAKIFKYL